MLNSSEEGGAYRSWAKQKLWCDLAEKCVKKLRPERARETEDWLQVGQALYSIDTRLFGVWSDWTAKHDSTKVNKCPKQWQAFRPKTCADLKSASVQRFGTSLTFLDKCNNAIQLPLFNTSGGTTDAKIELGDKIWLFSSKKELEIVLIDKSIPAVGVVPLGNSIDLKEKKIGGKAHNVNNILLRKCACCYRNAELTIDLQNSHSTITSEWVCKTCASFCSSSKRSQCRAFKYITLPLNKLSGAWIMKHKTCGLVRLPIEDAKWGISKLRSFAKTDEMINSMDASELIEAHQKEHNKSCSYSTWVNFKDIKSKAVSILKKLPPNSAKDDEFLTEVGKACFAISKDLRDVWMEWISLNFSDMKQEFIYSRYSELWSQFRPRTTADSEHVIRARHFIDDVEAKLSKTKKTLENDNQLETMKKCVKTIKDYLSSMSSIAYLLKDNTMMYVPALSSEGHIDTQDEMPAKIEVNDKIKTHRCKGWNVVKQINLILGRITLSSMDHPNLKRDIGIPDISGAWVQNNTLRVFRLPSENSTWGYRRLKELATLEIDTARNSIYDDHNNNNQCIGDTKLTQELAQVLTTCSPRIKILCSSSNSMRLGWVNSETLDMLRKYVDVIWELEMRENRGNQFTLIYSGREGTCNVDGLHPNTSYTFRLHSTVAELNSCEFIKRCFSVNTFATLPYAPDTPILSSIYYSPTQCFAQIILSKNSQQRQIGQSDFYILEIAKLSCYNQVEDGSLIWERIFCGRNWKPYAYNLIPGYLYAFRSCIRNQDLKASDWSPIFVHRIPKQKKCVKRVTKKRLKNKMLRRNEDNYRSEIENGLESLSSSKDSFTELKKSELFNTDIRISSRQNTDEPLEQLYFHYP